MSMSGMGGETGEESGRDAAGRSGEPAPRRRRPVAGRLAGWVVETLAVEAVRAVVALWAPEWSEAAGFLASAAYAAVGRRRGGRPRG